MAYGGTEFGRFQGKIMDYRDRLNPRYQKIKRQTTRYIIVHTSELGLDATLRVVSQGKNFTSGRTTPGGHAHYVIARNGTAYRILDHYFVADHAGLSMWDGQTDLSQVSVGIELVGYHHADISEAQYRSLGMLLEVLKKVYKLSDREILTHSQIAFGRPNPWFSKNHRGRKRCAKNFDRARAGLGPTWSHDPDVRAGRLSSDPMLAKVFYSGPGVRVPVPVPVPVSVPAVAMGSNIISRENTAWSIAGEDYNDASTAYILPDGRTLSGDRVESALGWSRVPVGTRVLLNQETAEVQIQSGDPVKTITGQMTAWSHAGLSYNKDTTIYFLPSGKIMPGSMIRDWDDLPVGTKLLVGYKGPFEITRAQTAYKIAGVHYKRHTVVYSVPARGLVSGDKMTDFGNLPHGVKIYLPAAKGPAS